MRKRIILLNEMWNIPEKVKYDMDLEHFERSLSHFQVKSEKNKENLENKENNKETKSNLEEINEKRVDNLNDKFFLSKADEIPNFKEMIIDTTKKSNQIDENELRRKRTLEALERRGIIKEN